MNEFPRSSGHIRPHHTKLMALVRILDSSVILLSMWLVIDLLNYPWDTRYSAYSLGGLLIYQFFAEYNEVYYSWKSSPTFKVLLLISLSWSMAVVILILIAFFAKSIGWTSRLVIGYWFVSTLLLLCFLHTLTRFVLSLMRMGGRNSQSVAIVGATELGQRLAESLASMPWHGYSLKGFYDDRRYDKGRRISINDTEICGGIDDLVNDAKSGQIEVIFITLPMQAEKRVANIMNLLADTTASVFFVPDLFVFNLVHSRWMMIQGIPCISVYGSPFQFQPTDGWLKRLEDIFLATIILVLIALPMLIIAIGVKLSSPGPVIFRQTRYGMSGESIQVWKFRTMTVCENGDVIRQATQDDPRVTRLGFFLRKYSLDELPQFINVLQGRMSIVGPRPHAVAHNELYRKVVQGYMLRHKVKPGITGLAQVSGCRGQTDTIEKMERRIAHDLEYIRHWTIFLDFKIILLTALSVFRDGNAY